jgi:hypothetical protein
MKLLHVLGAICFVAPLSLVACQSQNETFIAEEIAKIPACGVSAHTLSNQAIDERN